MEHGLFFRGMGVGIIIHVSFRKPGTEFSSLLARCGKFSVDPFQLVLVNVHLLCFGKLILL